MINTLVGKFGQNPYPELVFTVLFLLILYWIYEVVIHSRAFILDLPANIDF
jgi:hypothetical protein